MIYLRHADQRIQFEHIGQNYNERTVAAQQLLVPHPMELDPLNATLLEQHQELFQRQGFDIEAFGETSTD